MVGAQCGPVGPTKVVVNIGHRSSGEEGTRVRRTIEAEQDVRIEFGRDGGGMQPPQEGIFKTPR